MKLRMPCSTQQKLIHALQEPGVHEIGGVLMGEQLGEADFRIISLTIQKRKGTVASFVRVLSDAVASLWRFFKLTGNDYRRFNYLGEWHSHPLFPATPSQKDIYSMLEIVADEEVGANFAVLLIARLNGTCGLDTSATVFLSDQTYFPCEILKEGSLE